MERHEFLQKLGIGMIAVCSGCALTSCSSNSAKEEDPKPTPPNPPKPATGILAKADLTTELITVGTSKK